MRPVDADAIYNEALETHQNRNYPDGLCYLCAVCVEPDDFCSYGERR